MRPSYHRVHEIACAGARSARARGACDSRARIRLRRTQARVLRPGIAGAPRHHDGVVQRVALQLELFAGSQASRRFRLPGRVAVLRVPEPQAGGADHVDRPPRPGERTCVARATPPRRRLDDRVGSLTARDDRSRATACPAAIESRRRFRRTRTGRQHRRRARDAERALRTAEARDHWTERSVAHRRDRPLLVRDGVLGCGRRLAELRASRSGIHGRSGPAARVRDRRRACRRRTSTSAPGTSPTTARCGGSPKR